MGTPPLQKNGRDHRQDSDLRDLREQVRQQRQQNDADHSIIKDVLADLRVAVTTANERVNTTRTVAVVVWMLFLSALGAIGWVVNRAADTIGDVHERVEAVDARQQANTAKGWQWADKLESQDEEIQHEHERDIARIDKDIAELRRRMRQKE